MRRDPELLSSRWRQPANQGALKQVSLRGEWLMSDIGSGCMLIVVLILIGALVSLVALVPPIRRWCRRSVAARIATICTLGLMSFVISFGVYTWLYAEAIYAIGTIVRVDTFDPNIKPTVTPIETYYQGSRPVVVNEVWIRLLIPPGVRRACYAEEAWICDLADDVKFSGWDERGWGAYLLDVGIACVSVVASGVLVWRFTRRRQSATVS